jgi:hypothetical protein
MLWHSEGNKPYPERRTDISSCHKFIVLFPLCRISLCVRVGVNAVCMSWPPDLPRSLFVVGLLFAATGVISCRIVNCICSLSVDFMHCVNVTVYANRVYVVVQKKNGTVLGEDFVCGELRLSCLRFVTRKCVLFSVRPDAWMEVLIR